MLEIALSELEKAALDFYNITGIAIALYSEDRKNLFAPPLPDFCNELQKSGLLERCEKCDALAFDECAKRKGAYVYKCHMGLTEAFSPIIENGVVIGYISIGHILEDGSDAEAEKILKKVCAEYGFDEQKLYPMFSSLVHADKKFIESAVSLMSMCACYLYYNKIIKNKEKLLVYQIDEYIKTHLKEKLTVESLCDVFFISKTKLYNLSISEFGMGISDYIRTLRMEKAKHLLSDTQKNINQISEETGFNDANYFTRIFKKNEKVTPKEYRRGKRL